MPFVDQFTGTTPKENTVALFWLGQAGFLLKTSAGRTIAIDPYFSDCVMRMFPEQGLGFKRLTPPPCAADEIIFDDLLISHEHGDHFDVDSIESMMQNGRTHIYTNAPVAAQLKDMGIDQGRVHILRKGDSIALPGYGLTAVDCDHGELAPEALGFLLDFGFARIYYSGDTAFTPERLEVPLKQKPEVAILPINGAFGNLDGVQAAEYAGRLGCRICIPCHFWTFPLHRGNPQEIIDAFPQKASDCKLSLLRQGEGILIE